jgi:outer membrane protein assembly factor BamB
VRPLALLLVAAGLLAAGCGSRPGAVKTSAVKTDAVKTVTQVHTVSTADPVPDAPVRRARRAHAVQVTVVDGDTDKRVRGARVTIGKRSARSNSRGIVLIPLLRRASYLTSAVKHGYDERTVRLAFRQKPQSTIRIYRRSLQWTMYGADTQRTQSQASLKVRPPFRVVWSRGLGSLIEFPAVVKDGVAYIGNSQGTISALNMRNGKILWKHPTPNGKMASSPAVWRDQVVVHGMDGHVWVLRRSDGRLLWHYTLGSPIESSPVVIDGVDVFGAWNGTITALDLRTHRVRWRRHGGCKITSSVALAGSTLYIGDYCGRLLALQPGNGALRWSQSVNGRVYGTPAVSAGRVFVPSSTGGSLTAFSTRGRYLWRRSTGSYVYSSPAVANGRVFFGSYNGVFYALRASDGATLWSHSTGGPISGAAAVVDGVAYAGSFAHRILGVDARSGRVVLSFPHGEYVPVSGAGKRLLLHGYSRVFAVVRKR